MVLIGAWLIAVACQRADPVAVAQEGGSADSNPRPSSGLAIYVLVGQSNMTGGDATIPDTLPKNNGHIWSYTNAGTWELAREPLDDATGQIYAVSLDHNVGVGPGLSFATALYDAYPYRDIALIPCAKSGSSIRQWQRNLATDSLYGSCLARIREAQKRGVIEGIIFYQGEGDARKLSHARRWPERFIQLVNDLRDDLADEGLPVVFARLATVLPPLAYHYPAWDYLKARQTGIRHENVAMVGTDDLALCSEIHLSAESQIELGRRFARVFIERFGDRIAQ